MRESTLRMLAEEYRQIHGTGDVEYASAMQAGRVVWDDTVHGPACQHRGPVTETITRDLLACGCQTIRLHACGHFGELVTIQPIRRPNAVDTADQLRAAVAEFFPAYAGRSCRGCQVNPDANPASHPSTHTD
jgi:hypothetical protein